MSLGAAIERARDLYKQEGRARADALTVVRAWGYNSLNGSSLRVVSALRQYGLIDGSNEEIRLSERALTLLLEPNTSPEYADALQEALRTPALYEEVLTEFGSDIPSDGALVSFLVRKKNLGEPAAKSLIGAFRDSLELVGSQTTSYSEQPITSNAVAIVKQPDQTKSITDMVIDKLKPAIDLSFSWPLSKNTVLTIRVTGDVPSTDDVEDLTTLMDLAKSRIRREVEKAASEAKEAALDYVVEP